MQDLQELVAFYNYFIILIDDVFNNDQEWKDYYNLSTPETADIPFEYQDKPSSLQRMALFRCFRTDPLFLAAGKYVLDNMGKRYSEFSIVAYNSLIFNQQHQFYLLFFHHMQIQQVTTHISRKTLINRRRR
jgi:hypothetical protein